ncbi:hypothetical protein F4861DRAFT_67964 [Xylaria intraflava]|nr:hypothetical protein F4861DRAFT_67964 [Xylaria intraflava]
MAYISSSEDDLPDIEVIIQKHKQKSVAKELDGDKENAPTQSSLLQSIHTSFDESIGKTPATARRRRKLGQVQPVGNSLLKPWRREPEAEKETGTGRTPAPRQPSWARSSMRESGTPSTGDLFDHLPVKAKHFEPGHVPGATKFDSPPAERKRTKRLMSRGEMKALQLGIGHKETGKGLFATSSESEQATTDSRGKLGIRISDGDKSFDLDLSGDSDSDLDVKPQRRPQTPTGPRRMQRRILSSSRDPIKKPPTWTKSIQDDPVKSTKKRREKQNAPKEPTAAEAKAPPKGNLEDVFEKLKIFDEESRPETTAAKDDKKPILEPTTPRKTLAPSPVKTKVPTSPWKPEQKEFWDPAVNFEWIDQHSPAKGATQTVDLTGPDGQAQLTRKYGTSPEKKQAKKAFDAIKHDLARSFLQELDAVVTNGQLGQLTESTGGLRVVWSNTLLTTAGRAQWKCTTTTPKPAASSSSSSSATTAKATSEHHAYIELATKVLSNEADLLNTVAHEFCHLAVFILHGKPKLAHGAEFKMYGLRVMNAASARGALQTPRGHGVDINVTTRHSYKIEYPFIWRCQDCAAEVCRHSRSVDPARQRCGKCQGGVLVQVKPVPRGGRQDKADAANDDGASKDGPAATAQKTKKKSAYQEFMACEMKALSLSHKGLPFKEKMALVSARWSEHQKTAKEEPAGGADAGVISLPIRTLAAPVDGDGK